MNDIRRRLMALAVRYEMSEADADELDAIADSHEALRQATLTCGSCKHWTASPGESVGKCVAVSSPVIHSSRSSLIRFVQQGGTECKWFEEVEP